MNRSWINGILGVWLIVLAFLGLPSNIKSIFIMITGVVLALGFFSKGAGSVVSKAVEKENIDNNNEQKPEREIEIV